MTKFSKTESALWLLFFLAVAAFGFLQGWKPELHLSEYIAKPAKVEILCLSPVFFPPEELEAISKETHTQIHLRLAKNWDDLRLQLISDSAVDLIFLPSSEAEALRQEHLLHESRLFQDFKSERVSADFNFRAGEDRQDFFPVYWAQLNFYQTTANPKTLHFPDDVDLFSEAQKNGLDPKSMTNLKITRSAWSAWWSDPQKQADLFLAPHPAALEHPDWKVDAARPAWLAIWGFALPKNASLTSRGARFLQSYLDPERQTRLLKRLSLASTLRALDEKAGPLERKALYLRDLKMSRLKPIPRFTFSR